MVELITTSKTGFACKKVDIQPYTIQATIYGPTAEVYSFKEPALMRYIYMQLNVTNNDTVDRNLYIQLGTGVKGLHEVISVNAVTQATNTLIAAGATVNVLFWYTPFLKRYSSSITDWIEKIPVASIYVYASAGNVITVNSGYIFMCFDRGVVL